MKRPLEEAAEIFRRGEQALEGSPAAGGDARLYRGLALLAEGLNRLDRRLDQFESAHPENARRIVRTIPRRPRPPIFVPAPQH